MANSIYTSEYIDNATRSRYYYADRDVNDEVTLPYNFYDIKIKPNDLVTTHTINGAIGKLYDNLLYIISQSTVPQTLIPRKREYSTVITTEDTTTTGLSGLSAYSYTRVPSMLSNTQQNQLTNSAGGYITYLRGKSECYSGILLTDLGTKTSMSMFIDRGSEGVEFKSTTSALDNYTNRELLSANKMVEYEPDHVIYVLNTQYKVVYKYDMTGILTDDKSYFDPDTDIHGKLLMEFIGGYGEIADEMRFKNPVTIETSPSGDLYVVDTDNTTTVIKRFDKNANFIKKYDVTDLLSGEIPIDITFTSDRFVLMTSTSLHEFSLQFIYLNKWDLTKKIQLDEDEMYKQIIPSREDSNVIYLVTNRNIFKKFLSKPDQNIGPFVFQNRGLNVPEGIDISFVSVATHATGEYVYVCDRNAGVIYKFNEAMDYQKCIDPAFEKSFIKLQDIEIKSNESVNHIIYNKSLTKLFYNHALIGNNITSKMLSEWVDPYQKKFKAIRYALPEEIWSRGRSPSLNNFIGVNELIISSVVNRSLKSIFDFQLDMLKDIKLQVLNIRPPETVVDIPS